MIKWLLSLSFLLSAHQSFSQELDFGKINQIINGIADQLIEGDTFFQDLEGKIDGKKTDLLNGNVAGSLSVKVARTNWSDEDSSVGFAVTATKVGEIERTHTGSEPGDKPITSVFVQEDIQFGGTLLTDTVGFARYMWAVVGACTDARNDDGASYYSYVYAKVCEQAAPVMEGLSSLDQLISVVVDAISLSISSTNDFLILKNEELGNTQDEDQKAAIQIQIDYANKALETLNGVNFVQGSDSLEVSVDLDGLKVNGTLKASELALGLGFVYEMLKDDFDYLMESLHNTFLRIQEEDKGSLQDLKDLMANYLDLARSIAQPE